MTPNYVLLIDSHVHGQTGAFVALCEMVYIRELLLRWYKYYNPGLYHLTGTRWYEVSSWCGWSGRSGSTSESSKEASCEGCSGPVAESSGEASGTEGVALSNSRGVTSGSEGSRDC